MDDPDPDTQYHTPVIHNLGRRSRKKIRQLENRRQGELMDEIEAAVEAEVRRLGPAAQGKEILPVVFLYRQRRRRGRGRGGLPLPLPLPLPFCRF
jgi:hypothetical protein